MGVRALAPPAACTPSAQSSHELQLVAGAEQTTASTPRSGRRDGHLDHPALVDERPVGPRGQPAERRATGSREARRELGAQGRGDQRHVGGGAGREQRARGQPRSGREDLGSGDGEAGHRVGGHPGRLELEPQRPDGDDLVTGGARRVLAARAAQPPPGRGRQHERRRPGDHRSGRPVGRERVLDPVRGAHGQPSRSKVSRLGRRRGRRTAAGVGAGAGVATGVGAEAGAGRLRRTTRRRLRQRGDRAQALEHGSRRRAGAR